MKLYNKAKFRNKIRFSRIRFTVYSLYQRVKRELYVSVNFFSVVFEVFMFLRSFWSMCVFACLCISSFWIFRKISSLKSIWFWTLPVLLGKISCNFSIASKNVWENSHRTAVKFPKVWDIIVKIVPCGNFGSNPLRFWSLPFTLIG